MYMGTETSRYYYMGKNRDEKVLKDTTQILIHAGGYTQSISSSSSSEDITVDPVTYHCNGQEMNLQTCNNETTLQCTLYDSTVMVVCVQSNVSGMV